METIFKSGLMSPSSPEMMGITDSYVIDSLMSSLRIYFLGDIWLVSHLSDLIK